jgi:choline dehydrogenase-like flavoprotein
MGCPIDAKQSMVVTVLPDAVAKGLTIYANTSARALDWRGRTISSVHAEVLSPTTNKPTGIKVTVKAKLTVASGGAINTPGLLLRSGLDSEGRVGQRTWFHPVAAMLALFDQPVNAFSGAPQSVYSHHFAQRGEGKVGYLLEVPPVHPMLASLVATGTGAEAQAMIARLPYLNAMLALQIDGLLPEEEGATVRLKDGAFNRYAINYRFQASHWEAARESCKEMAKIQFAAGAKQVLSLHADPVVMNSLAEISKLDAAPWAPVRVKMFTAHQMGGCAMGKDPATSVVDPHLRYHAMDNLFVVDGSVLPTSLGVNPQETIFGIARWAAGHIAQAITS